jgi:hypothetical protein
MEPVIIRHELSPNGRFSLDISEPDEASPYYLATFRCVDGSAGLGGMDVSFGPYFAALPDELVIRWDLPDHVCGLFLGSHCYGLFRFGASRRRVRGSFRCRNHPPFTDEEIAWFCSKTRVQFRISRNDSP